MSKSILVVGGAGYIGSHTAKQLVKHGFTPVVVDSTVNDRPKMCKFGPSYQLSLPRDIDLLDDIVQRHQIDTCIHFAACTSVGESVSNPTKYYLNNVVMTLRLLEKLRSLNVNKMVFSSSAAVYGDVTTGVADTATPLQPINPYGKTKLIVEELLKDYYTAYEFSSISLRYFNAAGADPECEIGEVREKETHIVPLAITAALEGKQFKLFGNDFATKDGTCVRDYVHVTDLAEAHIAAVKLLQENLVCKQLNVGSGVGTSNLDLIHAIERAVGEFDVLVEERRNGDPAMLVSDIEYTKEILNWQPEQSSVDNIVQTAVQWHRKQLNMS